MLRSDWLKSDPRQGTISHSYLSCYATMWRKGSAGTYARSIHATSAWRVLVHCRWLYPEDGSSWT
jgi:hypothetical protein